MVLQISTNENVDFLRGTFERFFHEYNNLNIYNDSRRIEPRHVNSYAQDSSMFILDRAVCDGFVTAKWENRTSIKLDNTILTFPTAVQMIEIDTMQTQPDNLITLKDDDGHYIAQRKGNCVILGFPIAKCTIQIFDAVLTKLGFIKLSESEHLTRTLRTYIMKGLEGSIKDSQSRLSSAKTQMDSSFKQFISSRDTVSMYERQIYGFEKFDNEKEKNAMQQISRLMKSKYVDRLELNTSDMKMITKPLMCAIWNFGPYVVTYRAGGALPTIQRMLKTQNGYILSPSGEQTEESKTRDGCHISDTSPCSGNYSEMLKAFWTHDMLTGFNSAVKFIKSYSKPSGPYVEFEKFLMTLGYVKDAMILTQKGKVKEVDNGILYMFSDPEHAVTHEELKAWGCTGKIQTPTFAIRL